jgi:hypothetical protein
MFRRQHAHLVEGRNPKRMKTRIRRAANHEVGLAVTDHLRGLYDGDGACGARCDGAPAGALDRKHVAHRSSRGVRGNGVPEGGKSPSGIPPTAGSQGFVDLRETENAALATADHDGRAVSEACDPIFFQPGTAYGFGGCDNRELGGAIVMLVPKWRGQIVHMSGEAGSASGNRRVRNAANAPAAL